MLRSAHSLALSLCVVGALRAALPAPDPDNGGIELPPGFRAVVVADNLIGGRKVENSIDSLRFLTIKPNGDLYAKTYRGGILALHDRDGDGRYDEVKEFTRGGGTCILWRDGWLYHSTTTAVYRYRLGADEFLPTGEPETIVSGMDAHRNAHDAKCFAFDGEGRMIVEVGSYYNVFSKPDRQRGAKGGDPTEFLQSHGGFWRFDPNKLNQKLADGFHFSTGHRHSLAVAWHPVTKEFFMVQMGRDQLNIVDPEHYDELDNAERVAEEMHLLREGTNIGWPYSYWDPYKRARMLAPEYGGDGQKRCDDPRFDPPLIAFPAHWAPLQMAVYTGTQFPEKYRNGVFIAFHGSWNRAPRPQEGYNVSFVPFDERGLPRGEYEVFASGFPGKVTFNSAKDAKYRPGGLVVGPDGSLYVGDTEKGRIWRIFYSPEAAASAPSASAVRAATAAAPAPAGSDPVPLSAQARRGKTMYLQVCAVCHMADGSGAAAMQPALAGSSVVKGDPSLLIRAVLQGPAAVLPADRPKYSNIMPAFQGLPDAQIADILTYVRAAFGNGAAPVTKDDVTKLRTPTS